MNLPYRPTSLLALAHATFLPVAFLFATQAQAQDIRDGIIYYPGGFTMEVGEPGVLPPAVRAAQGQQLHSDNSGGANQTLKALAGGQSGFSAVWSDTRDGNLGLYFGLLGIGAKESADGIPIHAPRSSRQVLPTLAQFPLGSSRTAGAIAWTAQEMGGILTTVRMFDTSVAGEEVFTSPPISLGALDSFSGAQIQVLHNGFGAVAWLRAGSIVGRSLTRDTEKGVLRPGPEFTLAESVTAAGGQFHLALATTGDLAVGWTADGEMRLQLMSMPKTGEPGTAIGLGSGRILEVSRDEAAPDAGWWVLAQTKGQLSLIHLDITGRTDRKTAALAKGQVASADMCTWADGRAIAVVVEEKREQPPQLVPRCRAGAFQLHIFDDKGKAVTPPGGIDALDAGAMDARGPRIAASGVNFLVAWTDSRADTADVYYRQISLAEPFREAYCWNRDIASSDQTHAAVAASGETGVAVWEDGRDGEARIVARTIHVAAGSNATRREEANASRSLLLGEEIYAEFNGVRCAFPEVAVAEDTSFLVTWAESLEGGFVLRGQAFDSDGSSLGAATDLDSGHTVSGTWGSALVALPRNAGYMLTWTRSGEGPFALRLDHQGKALGSPHSLTNRTAENAARPALCHLDDGRFLAVWDDIGQSPPARGSASKVAGKPQEETRILSGRFLDANGHPQGESLHFAPSPNGGDLDPSVAPLRAGSLNPAGSFLLVWTGNDGPVRDVFARPMAPNGEPSGPAMGVSVKANEQDYPEVVRMPNGELFIAWEDDISGRDHCFMRRVSADGRALGPRMLINETATNYVEDRHAPMLAPLLTTGGPGLLAVWDDLARGLGHDVFGKWIAQEEKPLADSANH